MPHLDYDLHFWSLYYVMDIYKLEAVQRTISKIIQENRKKELNMQGNLNLHFLEKKIPRVREDDISMFKGVKVYNKRDMYKVLIVEEKVRTPRTCFKLDKFRFRKEIGKTWFTNKVVEEWNKLSHYLIGSGIVDALKKMIERLWKKTIRNALKFSKHRSDVVKKTNKLFNFIGKTFENKYQNIILPLFNELLRSHLEYWLQF